MNQLNQTNNILQNEYDTMKKTYEMKFSNQNFSFDHENLQQENELFRNAIDQWSNRYEELRIKLEQTTKYGFFNWIISIRPYFFCRLLTEKDERIAELQINMNNSKDSINENRMIEREIQTEEQQSLNTNDNDQLIVRNSSSSI